MNLNSTVERGKTSHGVTETRRNREIRGGARSCRLASCAAALASAALAAGAADAPSCIKSGDPAANAIAGSHTVASAGAALVTGSPAAVGSPCALEARYRTRDESAGVALDATKLSAFLMILR